MTIVERLISDVVVQLGVEVNTIYSIYLENVLDISP
jgi:hypothetical protein